MIIKSINLLILILILVLTGCQNILTKSYVETPPEWVEQILSRTTNLNSLEGNWEYLSVIEYDNAQCNGEGESFDYSGTIIYDISEANRSYTAVYLYSDFEDKIVNYTIEEFQSDCIAKEGIINSDGNCEMNGEDSLEYYLVEGGGYCEVYTKENKSVTYCGSATIDDHTANISFTWNSYNSKWDDEGCKVIELSSI